jgi:hypothetical protein
MATVMRRPRQADGLRSNDAEALILGYIIFEIRKVFRQFKCRIVLEDQFEEGEDQSGDSKRTGVLLVAEVEHEGEVFSAARIYKRLSRADMEGKRMRKMAYDVIGEIEKRMKE